MSIIKWHLDSVREDGGKLSVAGYASSDSHRPVSITLMGAKGEEVAGAKYFPVSRPDISRLLYGTADHPDCGFEIEAVTEGAKKFTLVMSDGETVRKTAVTPNGIINQLKQKRAAIRYNEANRPYQEWLAAQRATAKVLEAQRRVKFPLMPLISVVVPAFRTDPDYLAEMIESLRAQSYENWELCIHDAGSLEGKPEKVLLQYAKKDPRVRVKISAEQLGISDNTNEALTLAQGEFTAFMDHDDLLEPDALYRVIERLNERPDTDLFYTDEDKVTMDAKTYFEPHLKSDFNKDLLLTNNYISHFLVARSALVKKVGLLRSECDGSQDYDFLLRCMRYTNRVEHIGRVLYHWRSHPGSTAAGRAAKNYCAQAGLLALSDHLKDIGSDAQAMMAEQDGYYRIRYPKAERIPSISVVFTGVEDFARMAELQELLGTWGIDRGSVILQTKAGIMQQPKDALVLFLDSRQLPQGSDWLMQMLGVLEDPGVGAVCGKIVNADGTVAHCGLSLEEERSVRRSFAGFPEERISYGNLTNLRREVLGSLPTFFLTKGDLYRKVGGMKNGRDPLVQGFAYCMKLHAEGYTTVYEPEARLQLTGELHAPVSTTLTNEEAAMLGIGEDVGDPYFPEALRRNKENDYEVMI